MSLLLNCAESADVHAVSEQARAERRERLADFQELLKRFVWEGVGIDRHLLRLWLISSACKLEAVDSKKIWRRLARLLPSNSPCEEQNRPFCLQLLHLVCEVEPVKVGHLLAWHPQIVRHFFKDHPQHTSSWFQSSYVGSISEFRYGAKALAQYALLHRAKMWDLLVWKGKHPQAPVAVAAKPYYFSELDIKHTMQNILKHHQEFFASEQMLQTVKNGDILALDMDFFCKELYHLLVDNDLDVQEAIKASVAEQPFRLICQRLLHHLDDSSLLLFLSGILGNSYSQHQMQQLASATAHQSATSPISAAAASRNQLGQYLQCILFGCIQWRDLDSLSLHVAAAFHFQQLQDSWKSSGTSQELYSQARAICSSEASPVHWALLTSDAWGRHESKYHTLLLSLWAVKCTIFDQLSLSDKEQIAFLLNNGICASKSYSAPHLLLRPAKRRKSHKHKQQRKSHKKRNKSEGMRPSSGDESLSDGDLGIMTADADDNFIQTAAVWHLDAATHGLANLPAPIQDLPDVLLHLAIAQWIQHCCND